MMSDNLKLSIFHKIKCYGAMELPYKVGKVCHFQCQWWSPPLIWNNGETNIQVTTKALVHSSMNLE